MKLIVGLGNPGQKYLMNRHNVGFLGVDAVAQAFSFPPFKQQLKSLVSKGRIDNEPVILAKPQTYMNNSGQAVRGLMDYYKLELDDLLVLHDEVEFPFASMKFQKNRGHAGQNGVRDIHTHLGTNQYARLRLGVGRPSKGDVASYVLSNFSKQEEPLLTDYLNNVVDGVEAFVKNGLDKAANQFNNPSS